MNDPGYDFFATGRPAEPLDPPAPPAAALPGSAPAPPSGYPASPPPSRFGTAPVAVNQFGTPIQAAGIPTGPYAAPGIGAAPVGAPGLVSTWAGPGGGFAPPAPHARAAYDVKPGHVTAAAVISIVEGALTLLAGVLGLVGVLALRSQVADSGDAQLGALVGGLTTVLLAAVVFVIVIGAAYVVAGSFAVKGARWAVWALLVVHGLNALYALYQLLAHDGGATSLGSMAVAALVIALIMSRDSQAWLRRS